MKFRFKKLVAVVVVSVAVLFVCWTVLDQEDESKRLFQRSPFKADKPEMPRKDGNSIDRNSNNLKSSVSDLADDEDFSDNLPAAPVLSSNRDIHKNIDCIINDDYTVGCLKSTVDNMVYVPFSFLRKYFEVSGKLSKRPDDSEYFSWQHSYSKVFFPREPYDFRGTFLWFDNYNVEVRDRVKYISAMNGVPVSSQWKPEGHYYPIQIAQFGLSHFSKNLTLGKPRVLTLEDGLLSQTHWNLLNYHESDVKVETVIDEESLMKNEIKRGNVLRVEGAKVIFNVKKKKYNDLNLALELKPLSNFTLTLVLQSLDTNAAKEYKLFYTTNDEDITVKGSSVYYGIGSEYSWKSMLRDVGVDLQKALNIVNKKIMPKIKNVRLARIIFSGKALVSEVTLSSSAHEAQFKVAAKWLVQNQDKNGGWPVQVTRKLSNGELVLKPGWYSAMAQGQAISLLSRMYQVTRDSIYLDAAIKALDLFSINSSENGIRTYFLDKFVWYEEYPTVPSSYVLNGFVYSLFGLYDLKMTCGRPECETATQLYSDGLKSLKKLLTLFDTGSGSIYDLRHVSLGSAPNLARWDYHTTHINQLLYLNSIENELIFQTTAKRWVSYMKGHRAPHN